MVIALRTNAQAFFRFFAENGLLAAGTAFPQSFGHAALGTLDQIPPTAGIRCVRWHEIGIRGMESGRSEDRDSAESAQFLFQSIHA